jgi:hypothetical protein
VVDDSGVKRGGYLLLDACVLIDYRDADISILTVVSREVGPVAIARPVLDEVDGFDESAAAGLEVVDCAIDLLDDALRGPGPLSFADWVSLIVARQRRWTCVTNDVSLRQACEAESVAVKWGLELMLDAVGVGVITPERALATAVAIHEANPLFVTAAILGRFAARLGLSWRP